MRESGKSESARVGQGGSSTGIHEQLNYTDNGAYIEITGATGTLSGDIYIPDSIGGIPITEIAPNAFNGQAELKGPTTYNYVHPAGINNSSWR